MMNSSNIFNEYVKKCLVLQINWLVSEENLTLANGCAIIGRDIKNMIFYDSLYEMKRNTCKITGGVTHGKEKNIEDD